MLKGQTVAGTRLPSISSWTLSTAPSNSVSVEAISAASETSEEEGGGEPARGGSSSPKRPASSRTLSGSSIL